LTEDIQDSVNVQDNDRLLCGHVFHKNCLSRWFEASKGRSCPFCRKEDKSNSFSDEYVAFREKVMQTYKNWHLSSVIVKCCSNFLDNPSLIQEEKKVISVVNLVLFVLYEMLRSEIFNDETTECIKKLARHLTTLRIVNVIFDRQYEIFQRYSSPLLPNHI
jgi:hypothetical protein